jgi:tetratricopeptide (TPR) repeat protein
MQGRHHESQLWLDRVIALGDRIDPAQRAGVYLVLANAANNLEQHARARELYAESHRIAREAGEEMLVVQSLIGLGLELVAAAEYDQADATLAEALRMAEQGDVELALMPATYAVCRLAIARGNHAQAHRCLDRALDMVDPEDVGSRAYLQVERAPILRVDGRLTEALTLVRSCRETFARFGDRRALAACDIELAHLALAQGDDMVAGELFLSTGRDCYHVRDELNLVRSLEGLAALAIGRNQLTRAVALETVARTWRFRTGTSREFWEHPAFDAFPDTPRASAPGFEDALRLGEELLATTAPTGAGKSSIDRHP